MCVSPKFTGRSLHLLCDGIGGGVYGRNLGVGEVMKVRLP